MAARAQEGAAEPSVRPVHLTLVPASSIDAVVTDEDRERETLARFAEELRRAAAELPDSSPWKRPLCRAWRRLSQQLRRSPPRSRR